MSRAAIRLTTVLLSVCVATGLALYAGSAAAGPAPDASVKRFPAKAACDSATIKGSCVEYSRFVRTAKDEQKVCEIGINNTWVDGEGCPLDNLRGSCVVASRGTVTRWYAAGGNVRGSEAQVKDACKAMMGAYQPPSAR